MEKVKAVIFDIEILKAIEPDLSKRTPSISYCGGWDDKANMGISVLCAFDMFLNRPLVYFAEDLREFIDLLGQRDLLVGFNSINFDQQLLIANDFQIPATIDCYDILRETWSAAGLSTDTFSSAHKGFRLEDIARSNLGTGKVLDGATAPIEWQRGNRGKVIRYCLDDVFLTLELFQQILDTETIFDPRAGFREKPLCVRNPLPHWRAR